MPVRKNTTTRAPKTPAPFPYLVIRALDPECLNDVGNGDFTYTIGACDLTRDDGTPSQDGDVLSMQPDGSAQTRPEGASGSFERCKKTAAGAVYRPWGKGSIVVIIPLAQDVPNV